MAEFGLTKHENALVSTGIEIDETPPSGEEMAFTHSILCQVGLPRSKVEGTEFMRVSGDAWLNVQAGYLDQGNGAVLQPIPYGVMPRLILAWMSTYAIKNRTKDIELGDSASSFLEIMGMDTAGRRYTTLWSAMYSLAACRLQLGFRGRTYNGQPIKQFDAWLHNKTNTTRSLWPGMMVLSDEYYDTLLKSAVPLDRRALFALKGSALAMDIYVWLAQRLYRIGDKGAVIHWMSLRDQFGQEYVGKDSDRSFKRAFTNALKNVLTVYPAAKVKPVKGGILMLSSPPPIPLKKP